MEKNSVGEVYVENSGQRYKVQTVSDFRTFRAFATSESGWTDHYQYQNPVLKVQSRVDPTTKLTVFRVYREMPDVDPRALYDNFHDADYRRTWDTNMIDGYNICRLNAHNDIGYYSVKLPWPLANRDFCNMRAWMEFTNGDYAIFNHSVTHADCPEVKKFVRAKSHLTGYYVRPHGKGTSLIYVTHSDMGGSIPKTLTDTVLNQKVPDLMKNIETCAIKYIPWSMKQYQPGHVHAWTTPKMDWECTTMNYPQEEQKEAEKQALKAVEEVGQQASPSSPAKLGSSSANADLEREIAELRKKLLLANTAGGGGGTAISLAPVAPTQPDDTPDVQRYRAIMNDITNSIDRSFVQEGRMPTTREYMIRLHHALEGLRRTMPST